MSNCALPILGILLVHSAATELPPDVIELSSREHMTKNHSSITPSDPLFPPVTVGNLQHVLVLTDLSTNVLAHCRVLGLLVWLLPADEQSKFDSEKDYEISVPHTHH